MAEERQLSLFPSPAPVGATALGERLAMAHEEAAAIAARLPPLVRFGTSSWSFPGWAGIVWPRHAGAAWLARHGLADYARHPLLRAVGIDRGFYAPVPEEDLHRYASQLPEDFACCAKAPEAVTSPTGAGPGRAEDHPDFLRPERFVAEMVEPFLRILGKRTGPFLIQFPPFPPSRRMTPGDFAARLDAFLAGLPPEGRYAVELRDPALLSDAYRAVLARHGAAHVYNYASGMPYPAEQARRVAADAAPFLVVRLLMRPGSRYAARREAFAPFDALVDEDPRMRAETADLVRGAVAAGQPAFVLVNNKAEGSAPLTIKLLAELVAA